MQFGPLVIRYMYDNNKKVKHTQKQKNLVFLRDKCVSDKKQKTIQQKQLMYTDANHFNALQNLYYLLLQLYFSLM